MPDTTTPSLKLTKIEADRKNWSATMNRNMTIIDAAVSAYFVINNLRGVWENSTIYDVNDTVVDETSAVVYVAQVAHTSAAIPTTFLEERTEHPTFWTVYASPARFRGEWLPNTSYALNDFVVSDAQYAICAETHTSGSVFSVDVAAGKWIVLIDLSDLGLMPTPAGNPNQFPVTNGSATDYVLVNSSGALDLLGFTSFTKDLVDIDTALAFRTAIGAISSGDFQPLNANLTALSALVTASYGLSFNTLVDAASARAYLGTAADWRTYAGLGTAAVLDTGTTNGTIPVLGASGFLDTARIDTGTASGKVIVAGASGLPAIAASLLTALNASNVASGTLAKARGGTGQWASAYCTIAAGVLTEEKLSGMTSVVRDSGGHFTVTMSSAMPDTDYRVQITCRGNGAVIVFAAEDDGTARTTTVFKFITINAGGGAIDPTAFSIDVFE